MVSLFNPIVRNNQNQSISNVNFGQPVETKKNPIFNIIKNTLIAAGISLGINYFIRGLK